MSIAYIDSSALLKLVVREDETPALEADLAERDGLVTSTLAIVECRRALRRAGPKRLLQHANGVFESIYLVELTRPILERAADLDPALLRSLDAIHLATAMAVGDPGLELLTYDDRLAEGARAAGLVVRQPGRSSAPASRPPASEPGAKAPRIDPDPVVEVFKKDVDRTLLRENLKLSPTDRLRKRQNAVRRAAAFGEATRKKRS